MKGEQIFFLKSQIANVRLVDHAYSAISGQPDNSYFQMLNVWP